MATKATAVETPELISSAEARAILGIDQQQLMRMAKKGVVSFRKAPGIRTKYVRSSVEQVATSFIKLATVAV